MRMTRRGVALRWSAVLTAGVLLLPLAAPFLCGVPESMPPMHHAGAPLATLGPPQTWDPGAAACPVVASCVTPQLTLMPPGATPGFSLPTGLLAIPSRDAFHDVAAAAPLTPPPRA